MKKIFLDTNVWLRFFLKDNEKQYRAVEKLLISIEEGKFRPYTSSIVFLELNYVLVGIYKLALDKIWKIFAEIRKVRNITILEKTNINKTIDYHQRYKIKFRDCLIASQINKNLSLITYDRELAKIQEINCFIPEEIINSF